MYRRLKALLIVLATILLLTSSGMGIFVARAQSPDEAPTAAPTDQPTAQPTDQPTAQPTDQPTAAPTDQPTAQPTDQPTAQPTDQPTAQPTDQPTAQPTDQPTAQPTDQPTAQPTDQPTAQPTDQPTAAPTDTVTDTLAASADEVSVAATNPNSSFPLIQNTDSTNPASVNIAFRNTAGTVEYNFTDTIQPFSSNQYNVINYGSIVSSLTAAVYESGNRLVGVSVNVAIPALTNADAYETQSQGATDLFFPAVHRLPIQTSLIGVQNTSNVATTIAMTFTDNTNGQQLVLNDTVQGLSAKYFNTANLTQLGTPDGASNFIGSAVVHSNSQPIVASLITTLGSGTYSYNAFTPNQASTKIFVPNVHRFCGSQTCIPYGQNTWLLVQNTSTTQAANITITFNDNLNNPGFTFSFGDTIPAGQAREYATFQNTNLPLNFGGNAVVDSTGGQIVVNSVEFLPIGTYSYYSANGMIASDGATTVYTPDQHRRPNSGPFNAQSSYTLVQNVDDATAQVRIKYYSATGQLVAQSGVINIDPNKGKQFGTRDLNFNQTGQAVDGSFDGGGVVESINGEKVIANVLTLFFSDTYSYNGFK